MQSDQITLERLRKARHKVAQLVMIDRVYLPIFKRLKHEFEIRLKEDDLIARARAIANG